MPGTGRVSYGPLLHRPLSYHCCIHVLPLRIPLLYPCVAPINCWFQHQANIWPQKLVDLIMTGTGRVSYGPLLHRPLRILYAFVAIENTIAVSMCCANKLLVLTPCQHFLATTIGFGWCLGREGCPMDLFSTDHWVTIAVLPLPLCVAIVTIAVSMCCADKV